MHGYMKLTVSEQCSVGDEYAYFLKTWFIFSVIDSIVAVGVMLVYGSTNMTIQS